MAEEKSPPSPAGPTFENRLSAVEARYQGIVKDLEDLRHEVNSLKASLTLRGKAKARKTRRATDDSIRAEEW